MTIGRIGLRPASAKNKGRLGQQGVRDAILNVFPELEPDDVRSTGMGQTGEDLQLSPAARKLLPIQIEVKNKATSQIHTFYDQAKTHGNYEPIVIVKRDRSIYLATMSLDYFLELLREKNNKST